MIGALIVLIVWLLIIGILVALAIWLLGQLGLPEPIRRIIYVAVVVLVTLVVILLLLQLIGGAGLQLPKLT